MKISYNKEERKRWYYNLGLLFTIIGFSIFHLYDIHIYPEITLKVLIRGYFIGYCILLLVALKYTPNRYLSVFDFLIFIPACLIITIQCFISDGYENDNYTGFVMIIFIASMLFEIKTIRFAILLMITTSAHFIILSYYPVFSAKGFFSHLIYISLATVMGLIMNLLVNQMRERENQNLQEKETLLREIHHRVKNNLQLIVSLLNLQSSAVNDPEIRTALIESQYRIKSMALIHQLLYQSDMLSRVDFSAYLKQLAHSLQSTYVLPEKNIRCNVNAENIEFDIETAIPLGLIANELVSNAFKYAFTHSNEGRIDISVMRTAENQYLMEVSDNGTGLPGNYNLEKAKTLGHKLVNLLTRQIEGKISYAVNKDTSFRISFNNHTNADRKDYL
ncbi:MAG: sensor histidine kinase [Bacteroidales bacterium]|nr:sensor histidine kinase [Bacteroidales bacterium]